MKKLIALAIAILMMATLAVPAFAEPTVITQNSNPKTGTTTVTYSPAEGYTVTIPDTLTVGGSATLSIVSNYAEAKTFNVTVEGDFKLQKDGAGTEYAYELKADGTAIVEGKVITNASLAQGTKEVALTAEFAQSAPTAAGTYTDTLTFTVAVTPAA